MGLRRSEHSWKVALEWVRQGPWANDHFQRAQGAYLVECHAMTRRLPCGDSPGPVDPPPLPLGGGGRKKFHPGRRNLNPRVKHTCRG